MIPARPPARRPVPAGPSLVALAAAVLLVVGLAPMVGVAPVAASDATAGDANAAGGTPANLQPTVQYEEAVAHAGDKTAFAPGARVSVPFKPRAADRWSVGGVRPRELPAGLLGGKALRAAKRPGPPIRNDPPAAAATGFGGGPNLAAIDRPYVDPASAPMADLAAAVDPGGLKREVFGFLPYWELTDSSTRLDWEKLSTIAYFGVGVAANGDLQKKNADGSTTVGWSGWTSAAMTKVMNSAHASGARVVLTVQSFAWTSAGVIRQRSLLGSAANRANLARQIAAAVRDRGADGVNLDFEPIVSAYSDEFTALVRTIRKRAQQGRPRLPGHVRCDRLDRELPDRRRDRVRRSRRRGGDGLRLSDRIRERRRLGRPVGWADLRRRRHDPGLRLPDPGVEDHPRRAVLRPRLVDRVIGSPCQERVRRRSTGRRRPWSTARP